MRVLHFIGDALVIARVIAMAWLRWRLRICVGTQHKQQRSYQSRGRRIRLDTGRYNVSRDVQ